MEHLNFLGILLESFTIIFSSKKLFTQITISAISPISLLSLSHGHISELLFSNTNHTLSAKVSLWLFNMVYVVSLVALYVLSSSLVVHSVARVYTTKGVCFTEAMGMVPSVWKRAVVTFGWSMMLIVAYDVATLLILSPWMSGSGSVYGLITGRAGIPGPALGVYVLGFVYFGMVWHLAGVVSVLEEECGVEALMKSMALVEGKLVISGAVFLFLNLCFVWVQVLLERFVVDGDEMVWVRVGCGIVCFVLLCGLTLLGLVAQTVIYFVCKSCHCEEMMHQARFGDYAPLRSNNV